MREGIGFLGVNNRLRRESFGRPFGTWRKMGARDTAIHRWAILGMSPRGKRPRPLLRVPACLSGEARHHGWAMRKRRIYLGLLLLAVAVGAIVVWSRAEREPEYGGKKLSEWVDGTDTNRARTEEAAEAIRQIGTNALPYLLKWMFYETPPWKAKLYAAVNDVIRSINSGWQITETKNLNRMNGAFAAFVALGPVAKIAIPDLVHGVQNDPARRGLYGSPREHSARYILVKLGSEAVPALVACLANQDDWVRFFAITQLNAMGSNALPALPALKRALTDPDSNVRDAATNAIRVIDWGWAE